MLVDKETLVIGEIIRARRIDKGLTQGKLARIAGVSRVAIGNYERGTRQPTALVAWRIADALDCEIGDIVPGARQITQEELDLDREKIYIIPSPTAFKQVRHKTAFLYHLNNISLVESEWRDLLDTLKDLTPQECRQIWDYARFVKSIRKKGADSNGANF